MAKLIATYAFEGINAGGKSTVIKKISSFSSKGNSHRL